MVNLTAQTMLGCRLDEMVGQHEGTINLEHIDRERLEIGQRGITGAEIVHGQLLRNGRRLDVGVLERERRARTLLIVDDEPEVRSALARTLHGEGWRVLGAGDACEALDTLATHGAQVVLCDQHMPGMTGSEFLGRIRQVFPETVSIIYSGKNNKEAMNAAVSGGIAYKALHKPWDDDELLEMVRAAFNAYEHEVESCREMPICGGKLACFDRECGRRVQ